MKKITTLLLGLLAICFIPMQGQLSPAITAWLQNTTETGTYYISGNSTAISNGELVNCQQVEYSNDFVYITATGIPAYPTGPFLDKQESQLLLYRQNRLNIQTILSI